MLIFYLILETNILEESKNKDINYLVRTNLVTSSTRAYRGKIYYIGANYNTINHTAPISV